ncbi:MAG: ATP-binding protein [Fidelibacterota bacterium]
MNIALLQGFNVIDGVTLVVALLGTVQYLLETSVLFKKPGKFYEEWVVSATSVAFLLYFVGTFMALFGRALVADIANVMYRTGWMIATSGFVFIPSLLIHSYGSGYYYARVGTVSAAPRKKGPNAVFFASHLAGFYFLYQFLGGLAGDRPVPRAILTSNIDPVQFRLFAAWLGVACVVAGLYSIRLTKNPPWERWRKYFPINGIFLFVAAVVAWGVLRQYPLNVGTAPLVRLLFLTLGLFPGVLLAYFLVRYQFMNIFVKPTLIYAVLTGLIVLIYQLGIRNISHYLARFPAVNVRLVEMVLLLGLIFLVHPARVRLQTRINHIFFPESRRYQDTVYRISQQLKSTFDLDRIGRRISQALKKILRVDTVGVILRSRPEADGFAETFHAVELSPEGVLFDHVVPSAVSEEMARTGYRLVVAVRDGKEMLGMIGVGPKQYKEELSNDEVHLLRTIANQLAMSIRNAVLVEEQLKLERLMMRQEKLSALGQIAASLTHEVKNPMSSIHTLVQVMQEEVPGGDDLKKDLETIEQEIIRLNKVVTGILKYARPESMELSVVDVTEVIQDVLVLLGKEAQRCGVELDFSRTPGLKVRATLDGLKDVFFNIVLNAIQACGDSGGRITIQSHLVNRQLQVKVQDSGAGIPQEQLSQIFEPYYTTKEGGTGLGLSMVKKKVETFRGTVSVCNLEGGGAQFIVDLPVVKENENA